MTSRFDDDLEQPRHYGLHIGYVTDRNDPEELGRVQVCVPGLLEPHSGWAWPLGTSGGGSKNRGFFAIPEVNAEVAVWFNQGDLNGDLFYLPAHWGKPGGESEVPAEAQKTRFQITNLANGDAIAFDAEKNTLVISATTSITIQALGAIQLVASHITLNGRVLRPVTDAI
jgi:uncharacterized protein involved in type VI secretion and phage assembly